MINIEDSITYKNVLLHRNQCKGWEHGKPCIRCWGGGLLRFTRELMRELGAD